MAPISLLLEARKWFNPHKLPYWRMEQDYWMKESYLDPKSKDARFNSCSNPHLNIANVCNGRGSCLPFGDTGVSFCRCNPGFGGAECESKRLSQITAWFLCLFLGPFGADQYYLGWYPEMIVTQMLSILGAALLISVPNSKLPGGILAGGKLFNIQLFHRFIRIFTCFSSLIQKNGHPEMQIIKGWNQNSATFPGQAWWCCWALGCDTL